MVRTLGASVPTAGPHCCRNTCLSLLGQSHLQGFTSFVLCLSPQVSDIVLLKYLLLKWSPSQCLKPRLLYYYRIPQLGGYCCLQKDGHRLQLGAWNGTAWSFTTATSKFSPNFWLSYLIKLEPSNSPHQPAFRFLCCFTPHTWQGAPSPMKGQVATGFLHHLLCQHLREPALTVFLSSDLL